MNQLFECVQVAWIAIASGIVDSQLKQSLELAPKVDGLQKIQFIVTEGVHIADLFAAVKEVKEAEELWHRQFRCHKEVQSPEQSLIDDLVELFAGHSQISNISVAQVVTNEPDH